MSETSMTSTTTFPGPTHSLDCEFKFDSKDITSYSVTITVDDKKPNAHTNVKPGDSVPFTIDAKLLPTKKTIVKAEISTGVEIPSSGHAAIKFKPRR